MNSPPDNITTAAPRKPDAGEAGSASRWATVLQVLPAVGEAGGVERGAVEINGAIVGAGGRALVASAGGALQHEITRAGGEHVQLPLASKNPLVMRANVGHLTRLIRDHGVDIVHARSRAPAWSAFYAARATGARFVTTFHGTYGTQNWAKRTYNSVMTRGEKVIAISRFIAGHIHRVYGVPARQIRVIHRGVDLARFDPAQVSTERVVALAAKCRFPDGVFTVMLPGRLTRWKGHRVFIEAVALLARRDICCLIVGSDQGREDYRGELEALIEKRGVGGVFRIIDHCNDMPAAYMLTDLVVSASTDPEAFGRVVPEAQALGRPVIASDHGGARETLIPDVTGWLTPPGDAEALAGAIDRVLNMDDATRRRLAERAIANARENFSKDVMCAKTLDVYDEVLDQGPRPDHR
ncbi:MAG: glycosyltransferase family 4 protein [Rhodospirillales bacterium]|nr:glycosyltransferase family 4 protein [Rhodospirillales bacterium]